MEKNYSKVFLFSKDVYSKKDVDTFSLAACLRIEILDEENKVDENLNVLEELGQADTFLYTKTNFNNKIFVKNERDFDLIKSLPYYQNNVELVKEFPNE